LAQTTLRAVLASTNWMSCWPTRATERGHSPVLDAQTDAWGIKVANVEIKHVDLNESMVRAIARQARPNANGGPR
jgi:regulator of protease activity HflC (stomatin/prohibitin superfamily)